MFYYSNRIGMTQFTNASLINPGPDNTSLLYLQRQHVSEAVWQGYVS